MKFWLILWLFVIGFDKLVKGQFELTDEYVSHYFNNDPPDDYLQRKSLEDCPTRFYTDNEKFNYAKDTRIVEAWGEVQHLAAIGWNNSGVIKYLCAGSLLTRSFILTTASCADDVEGVPPTTVLLGLADEEFNNKIKIKSIKKHPQYIPSKKYHDIALIELEEYAWFDQAVCSACLWLEENAQKEKMYAVGFGGTSYSDVYRTIDRDECIERLSEDDSGLPDGLLESQFCAASTNQDTSQGVLGGPLQVERLDVDDNMIPLIVGIMSFGFQSTAGSTGVYTRVASYRDWIEQEIGQSFSYLACARTAGAQHRKYVKSNFKTPPYSPYHRVGLIWDQTDTYEFHCGATLVDYRFALTSAYCAKLKQGFPKFIIVEDVKITIPIEAVYIHPMYGQDKPENDLALLKLTKYVNPESFVLPACLWRDSTVKDESDWMHYSAMSSSFDTPEDFNETNRRRYVVGAKIVNNGKCKNKKNEDKNLLCGKNNVKLIPTVCQVDFGGPVSNIAFQQYIPYIYAVVSNLTKDCEYEMVGVRVAPHLEWIENTILDHKSG